MADAGERAVHGHLSTSGRTGMGSHWLLRVITQDSRTTANVIANFRQLVKDGALKLHPIITRLVDAETLKKMGAVQMGRDEGEVVGRKDAKA